jgi:hypothetical protein
MITLVKRRGWPVAVGVGRYVFELRDGVPTHSEDQQAGARWRGLEAEYDAAFALATWAAESNRYDSVENNE